jgi:hypothetical protein
MAHDALGAHARDEMGRIESTVEGREDEGLSLSFLTG